MPRFSEQEKEMIHEKLLAEGERLFAMYGLKKVTVDDLVGAVNISKGSFYAFYPSKEHLYIEINFKLQDKLFQEMKEAVGRMQFTDGRALTKEVIMQGLQGLANSPILSQMDVMTMEYLWRKLPAEVFENHVHSDSRILEMLEEHGVEFVFPHSVMIKSLYTVLVCMEQYRKDEELAVIQNLLVDGIVEQCVKG